MSTSTHKETLPYGLWRSPISAALVSQGLRLEDVQFDSDGCTLVWLEGRSERGVLVARRQGEAARDLTVEHSVRGGIGYGGGEFAVAGGSVIFAARDGRLYRRSLAADPPRAITPPFGSAAAPAISPDGDWVAYVFSDGVDDLIALVDSHGRDWSIKLTRGADFYMQPVWHPAGDRLAWVEWYHPNMPWDGSRLQLTNLEGSPPRLTTQTLVDGSAADAVIQPQFSPDGKWLSYIITTGEWERLVILDLQSGEKRTLVRGDGFHLARPPWIQGMRFYGWSASSQRVFYLRNYAGAASLWQVELESGETTPIDIAPYTWLSQLSVSSVEDQLALIASSPTIPDRILRWDGNTIWIEARSESEIIPPELLPQSQPISWRASDDTPVHGLYYPPTNPDFTGKGLPPAIINVHGGPTSQATTRYSSEIAFFTSRGYAWLELNYRGSSGYGRSYQNALRECWGEVDV
ncbi:MAG: prolyl oligopeptidase family serine peptidase, partial [Anaerolineaceae bacterium]|nr:prolyl oligopeptidase family serine peptidase [Anaerolineaceae bacterium]